ncbi:microcin ABC transporter ATP-binding protein [Caulobacter sp. Root655]|uniref:ABC transporter ATP-binding protein n=1 Tax=Caulobacter sp. Root655 TaxID=1736578 RepID=UPI0006F70825|nr:dipeptide ABC transporter ATP-binding protein [Caulobacter sp. Root655]KRA64970.1 microcin ABC transporter ATP-binding protein [Caulobacter sp. Root655]
MALLEIENLRVTIGATPILNGLSLSLEPGQVLGVVGESGSGKSMTALSILGLSPQGAQTTGAIRFDDQDLTRLSETELCGVRGARIGMVFQEPMTALNPVMTIGDQVAEVVRLHQGGSRAKALEIARQALERVGLPAERFPLGRYPHELSGGQRQRVAIAIAIVLSPRLIIADEPTTALDVTTQAQILELLRRLVREDGAALILVSHDLAVVAGLADHVAVMKDGRIVETGETSALFSELKHPYTRALAADATRVPVRRGHPASSAQPVLEAENVVRDYPGPRRFLRATIPFRAVSEVSLAIRPGEIVGLVGESGCGKSTLLRTLLALETPQGGQVRLSGQPFSPASPRALRRHIQVVFQDPHGSFDPRWTVERLVAEPLHLLNDRPSPADRRRKVEAALAKVGLPAQAADRHPHQFSGGQRQRIAIARALIVEPSVIALDEAVSALDVTVRAEVLDLLAGLSDELGLAYLFVSHDMGVVRGLTDRVLVMKAGRIIEEGPTAEVFANPQHPYTAQLIAATPDLDRALAARG